MVELFISGTNSGHVQRCLFVCTISCLLSSSKTNTVIFHIEFCVVFSHEDITQNPGWAITAHVNTFESRHAYIEKIEETSLSLGKDSKIDVSQLVSFIYLTAYLYDVVGSLKSEGVSSNVELDGWQAVDIIA